MIEGSRAIAETIKLIKPAVVSAYPITPQTHIVEDLAKFKADGDADYEYVRAESEFAAASIVLGSSATGVRTYTATSSQGLLLMAEVIFNISGMRLPVVMTCANRAVSAPISIWNDHQDAMTIRDAGWIMLFAENSQEAVDLHIVAYKVAEKLNIPVVVNVDGFVLTHTYEPVKLPTQVQVNKFLPKYKPKKGSYLDVDSPKTLGAFATPEHYMEIRQELHNQIGDSKDFIKKEIKKWTEEVDIKSGIGGKKGRIKIIDSGLTEYYGAKKPQVLLIAMGSVVGTIKDFVDRHNAYFRNGGVGGTAIGVLKVRSFRPLPKNDIIKIMKMARCVAVLDKSISLGEEGVLAQEIKSSAFGVAKCKIQSFIVGLGGRDITEKTIEDIIIKVKVKNGKVWFVG